MLSEKLKTPKAFHVFRGPRDIFRLALEALCPLLTEGTRIYWVDAANRFDARALAVAAQSLGMNPRTVLSRIQLARTFNAFQLAALMTGKLRRLPPAPVVLADPLRSFYDEDLSLEDAWRAFDRVRLGLADVPGPVLALVVDRSVSDDRADFAPRFLKLAQSVTDVGPSLLGPS